MLCCNLVCLLNLHCTEPLTSYDDTVVGGQDLRYTSPLPDRQTHGWCASQPCGRQIALDPSENNGRGLDLGYQDQWSIPSHVMCKSLSMNGAFNAYESECEAFAVANHRTVSIQYTHTLTALLVFMITVIQGSADRIMKHLQKYNVESKRLSKTCLHDPCMPIFTPAYTHRQNNKHQ